MKIFFIGSSIYILYLMWFRYKATYDASLDTFRVEYLIGVSLILGLASTADYTVIEVLWSFSIWLESVAILPQLFMLQKAGEAETITTHYLFALGAYRALYLLNWIYRYITEGYVDWVAWVAGLIQTALYSDFFYIYYNKVLKGEKFELPRMV
ncbi:ER lumen protein retaining receptor-domain-containing protein [Mycotypha africana]|uniref:ER lumen protein retaining receptor-domain-containing protein n=1 Tax=Mycotypha africana TaxID=64632 RepID=UPI0023000594|nr:ER lumen protein retaining receptor-domain-containing protein [Mycotypha africana]KAI8990779.1 ER lumen protein retaining receptor-domain-containing protein [Mycotypha africana]